MQKFFLFLFVFIFTNINVIAQKKYNQNIQQAEDAIVGASRLELYLLLVVYFDCIFFEQ